MTKVSSSISETEFLSFDIVGKVLAHRQVTDGNSYDTGYSYNLTGALIEETYPSGRKVKNTLDAIGRLSKAETKTSSGAYQTRIAGFNYTAHGATSSITLGNNRFESTKFNARLQPIKIALGTSQNATDLLKLDFSYGTSNNSGNVVSQTISTPSTSGATAFTANQTYTYDSINRISSAVEKVGTSETWRQNFSFDRYGNRNFATGTTTIASCPANQCNPTVNASNNRFNSGQGYSYDSSGNVIADAEGRSFIYDAENKQKEVKNSSGSVVGTYFFDGDGKRIKKVTASETTVFVYDAGGTLVAEYSTKTPQATAATSYLTTDHLGSPRIITDATGNVISRRDFMPFGEEIKFGTGSRTEAQGYTFGDTAAKPGDSTTQKFTTYERDDETNLDFAQARMHNYNHGRFTSPDPFLGSARRQVPQTWNRYIYVGNNPHKYTDPGGLDWGYRKLENGRKEYRYCPGVGTTCKGFTLLKGSMIIFGAVELSNGEPTGKSLGDVYLDNATGKAKSIWANKSSGNSAMEDAEIRVRRNIFGGLLCTISQRLFCMQQEGSSGDRLAAAGDVVQLAFLVKTLAVAGVSAVAMAAIIKKNPDDIVKIAKKVLAKGKYKLYKCLDCAEDMLKAFKDAGLDAKIVQLKSPNGEPLIRAATGEGISLSGNHFGVQVGDKIYEMYSTKGIPVKDWAKQYQYAEGIKVVNPKFSVKPPQ